jgi:hypothetical protein
VSPQQSAPVSNIPGRDPLFTGQQQRKAGIWHWWIGLNTELKVPVICGLFGILVAIVTGICNLGVAIYNGSKPAPALSATPMPTTSASTPEAPQPKTATVYYNYAAKPFIQASYDPPQLHAGEVLFFQASTSPNFDDNPPLMVPLEIEYVPRGFLQGLLLRDPRDQKVWYRFFIKTAHETYFGESSIASKR